MNEEKQIVAWLSKYALSIGVIPVNATDLGDGIIRYRSEANGLEQYAHKRDWHDNRYAALQKAEEMRVKKIASLKKQIAKLETLKFK